MSRRWLRPKARISYYEPEEPNLDEYVFCEKCADYVFEYCSIHGALLVVPDDKVPAKHNYPPSVPRAALTIPHVFLHLNYSSIPGAGLGVFATLTLPKGVRFGPYRGLKSKEVISDYSWQIYGTDRKPCHVVDASDGNTSNWMRFVNCSRHWREQNLVAFQYRGELYYRTIKIIPRFTELMVFYGSEYANKLNIDLGKYNAPKSFAQKFGASAPKKPKISPDTKTTKDAVYVHDVILKQNEVLSEEEKTANKPNLCNNTTSIKCVQEMKKNKRRKIEAPAAKKRKFEVKNKKLVERVRKHTESIQKEINGQVVTQVCNKIDVETEPNNTKKEIKTEDEIDKIRISAENIGINIGNPDSSAPAAIVATPNKNGCNVNTNIRFDEMSNTQTKKQNAVRVEMQDAYFVCDLCKYKSVTKTCLEKHMKLHDVNRKYACESCTNRYAKNSQLNIHKLCHYMSNNQVNLHECNIYNFKTSKKISFKTHLLIHTGLKLFSCDVCNYKCTRADSLKEHMRTHTGERPYSCNVCNYKCTQAGSLKRHMRTHTGERPYSCNVCNYKCTQAVHLKEHMRTHTGERPYSCNVCNYKCTQAGSLKSHMRTHTGERPYSCNVCNYKCTQAGSLKSHMRTHTGERPYSCNVCNYKCTQAGSLKSHMRTHTGERPYSCNVCNYKCKQAGSLKSHMRTHTGERPYSCNVCNYKCTLAGSLKIHMRTHTGERPYSCNICEYTCSFCSQLKKHLKNKHLS